MHACIIMHGSSVPQWMKKIRTFSPAPSSSFSVNSFPLVVMTYTLGAAAAGVDDGDDADDAEDEEEGEVRRWRMPVFP